MAQVVPQAMLSCQHAAWPGGAGWGERRGCTPAATMLRHEQVQPAATHHLQPSKPMNPDKTFQQKQSLRKGCRLGSGCYSNVLALGQQWRVAPRLHASSTPAGSKHTQHRQRVSSGPKHACCTFIETWLAPMLHTDRQLLAAYPLAAAALTLTSSSGCTRLRHQ